MAFYTNKKNCIQCEVPMLAASELIAMDEDGCFFHRQPANPGELAVAIEACLVSCSDNYRYSGSDPEIIARIAEAGGGHLCDHPVTRSLVVRERVRLSMPNGIDARGVAAELAEALLASHTGYSLGSIEGDKKLATFACMSMNALQPNRYSVEWISAAGSVGTAYRDADPRSVWLLTSLDGARQSMRFHEKLLAVGAADLRWFSRDEWQRGGPGRAYPLQK